MPEIKEPQMKNPPEVANAVINRWLDDTHGLPIPFQLTQLGFAVIAALESAYREGYQDALADHGITD